jgi:hypothetical protein
MAALALPPGSTQLYQKRFDALADDDTRRGYLVWYSRNASKQTGAKDITRWINLPDAERELFITRTAGPNHVSDSESQSEEGLQRSDLENARDVGQKVDAPNNKVASPANNETPDAADGAEKSDNEPSDEEAAIARVGLSEAHTGQALPSQTKKKRPRRSRSGCNTKMAMVQDIDGLSYSVQRRVKRDAHCGMLVCAMRRV